MDHDRLNVVETGSGKILANIHITHLHIEGFQPEWYISTIIYSGDILSREFAADTRILAEKKIAEKCIFLGKKIDKHTFFFL